MGANTVLEVGARPVPEEPMYIIMNLGPSFFSFIKIVGNPQTDLLFCSTHLALSTAFGSIDYDGLADLWPVHMVRLDILPD